MKKELLFTLTLLLGISTVFAQRTSGPNFSTDISVTRDKGIYLSGSPIADPHHGIKYSYSEFANTFVDGPVIFGYSGGALGTNNSFTTSQTIALRWNTNGNVLISNKLEAKEIKVTETPTADFVFEESYELPPLIEVEEYIKEKKHLPEITSAQEMKKNGVNIGDFQIKLLQKIEELTLYIIQQEKEINKMKQDIKLLKNE